MNGFYLAKKKLKYSGNLDLVFVVSWSILLFVISLYHFGFLVSGSNKYSSLSNESSSHTNSVNYSSSFISSKGYSEFFNVELMDLVLVKLNLWFIVLSLFLISLLSFLGKVVLGVISLFWFLKSKSLLHIYAAISVIFLPLIGGIIAINTYKSTTSPLSPRYISSYSLIRARARNFWKNLINDEDK